MQPISSSRALALPLTALCALASAPRADGDGAGAPARLETGEAVIGQTLRITVRSQLPGAFGLLAVGNQPFPIVLGGAFPVLLTGIPIAMPAGVLDATGRLELHVPIAPAFPPGVEVFAQAAVLQPTPLLAFGSTLARIAPGGPPAAYADAPFALPASTSAFGSADVDWADLDHDGRLDAVVASEGSGARPLLLVNQGVGFADQAPSLLPAAALVSTAHVEAGDVDLDGRLDLVLSGGHDPAAPRPNLLLLAQGGAYVADASFPPGAGVAIDTELADVDGDGDPDLVLANKADPDHPAEAPDGIELYVNSAGTFVPDAGFAGLPATGTHGSGGGIGLGDADNDGDLDLFVARSDPSAGGAQNQLLLNDGFGHFFDFTSQSLPAVTDNTQQAIFVDVDADGWLDVAAANSVLTTPTSVGIYRNTTPTTGLVTFADASSLLPASFGGATNVRMSLDAADVDGDGDQDLAFGIHQLFDDFGALDGDAVLVLNQGGAQGGAAGSFAVDPGFDLGGSGFVAPDLAFGDYDGDGDPDLYLASDGDLFGAAPPQDRLVRNAL